MNLTVSQYFKEFLIKSVVVLTNDSFILYNEIYQYVSGLYSSGNQYFSNDQCMIQNYTRVKDPLKVQDEGRPSG